MPSRKIYSSERDKLDRKIEKGFYGFDTHKVDERINEVTRIAKQSLGKINSFALTGKNTDIIDLFNETMYNSKSRPDSKTHAKNYQGFIDDVERGEINLMFENEQSRFQRYRAIDAVCQMIPQLGRIVRMYRDMIITPNDFRNSDFLFLISNSGDDDEAELEVKQKKLHDLDEKYKISEEIGMKMVSDLVKYGDAFGVVLNFREEVESMLSNPMLGAARESVMDDRDLSDLTLAKEDVDFLNSTTKSFIDRDYADWTSRRGKDKAGSKPVFKDLTQSEWEAEMDSFVNCSYSENILDILSEDERNLITELNDTSKLSVTDSGIMTAGLESASTSGSKKYNLAGSIVRHLDPGKVIKVEIGGVCIGYYYLDVTFDNNTKDSSAFDPNACPACDLTYTTNRMYSFVSHMNTKASSNDQRCGVLADLFAKRIGRKLNKKFIAKHNQFRDFIFTMLKANRRIDKLNMVFLPASKVIHLKRGSGVYGESVIDPVLFFAKVYALSMLSALIQQIVLGKDKQVYYIETGLDEDSEGAVNAFIADMKQREITIDDFSDTTAILNRVTKSNAMYIPTVDGKKAVEFDTFAGQEAQFNNEFLDSLLKSIISGTGIPTAWLDSGFSDIEFATQLVQQNGQVLLAISNYQTACNRGFTAMFRQLLTNEEHGDSFEFEVMYPQPVTLDAKQTEESSSRASSIADFVVSTMLGEQPSEFDERCRSNFRKKIIMKLTSGVDWDDMENILKECRQDQKEIDLINKRVELEKTQAGDAGSSDDGSPF